MGDLARSRREGIARSTRKPLSKTINLDRDRDLNAPRPPRRYQQYDGGLRNRFYTPAINSVMSQIEAPRQGAIRWDSGDDPIYAEIRDVMPGVMGRQFARSVKRLKGRERDARGARYGNGTARNDTAFVPIDQPDTMITQF